MAREATIQKIESISPIKKADRLELATLEGMGWKFVVGKGAFKPGDLCVYFCIDSELPADAPWAKFLVERGTTRIKTMKLRGALSQGLALTLQEVLGVGPDIDAPIGDQYKPVYKALQDIGWDPDTNDWVLTGADVTEALGVKHYEKPIPEGMSGDPKGAFPGYVPKTDETMLQNIPEILQEMAGQEVYVTIKCDGTSTTFAQLKDEVDLCSRNWSMKEWSRQDDPDGKPPIHNLCWVMARKYGILDTLLANDGIAIQAEMVGPGIQGNRLGLDEIEIRVFDVWDINKAQYYNFQELWNFCIDYKLPMVPIVGIIPEDGSETENTVLMTGRMLTQEFWLKLASGNYPNTENRIEGIVTRTCKAQYLEGVQNRASFKALNNMFLLKDEE